MNVGQVMELARLEFLERAPYFATALYSLIPHPDTRIPTCAVTKGMVLLYNPEYFLQLAAMDQGILKVATRLWHEVNHILRDYFTEEGGQLVRLPGVDNTRRNICSDLAINSSGLPGGWDFGPDGILPNQYGLPDGRSMEEYHELLPQYPKLPEWGGMCGSGAGNPVDPELEEEVDRLYGRSKDECESIREQVAADVKKAAEGRFAGKLPAGLTEWAEALLQPPVVPWTRVFAQKVRYCTGMLVAGEDYDTSYQRPSARTYTTPCPDVIRPSEMGREVEAAFVLDTSGSMSLEYHLRPALREARGALAAAGVHRAWWLEVDTELGCDPRRVSLQDLVKVEVHGRGGTDFRPGIAAADALRPRPDLLIYITDGYGPAPRQPPERMVVIWLLVGKDATRPTSWGHVIHVEE